MILRWAGWVNCFFSGLLSAGVGGGGDADRTQGIDAGSEGFLSLPGEVGGCDPGCGVGLPGVSVFGMVCGFGLWLGVGWPWF